ncbi:hypothetical protein Tco_1253559 [Tanacetum coccineum]
MASYHSKSLYAIKECSTCGRLYTIECCSIGSLEDKILVPKFDEDLLAYCVENGIFQDCQDTSESSDGQYTLLMLFEAIRKADFDSNDDTLSDDDDFEDVEYVSLEEVNEVDQEKEFDLDDIIQIQDVILREKLLNVHRLISNIESLKDNPIPIMDSDSSITSLSFSNNSLPEFESFSDQTEETRSGSTTTHVNYSLPEFESFHFDLSFPDTPPEPPRSIPSHLPIRTFLPFSTYPRFLLYLVSPGCEDTSFDPGHLHLEQDYSDFEDSRALGFVPPFIRSFISCTDRKKMTKIKTKPDETEHGIEKSTRKRIISLFLKKLITLRNDFVPILLPQTTLPLIPIRTQTCDLISPSSSVYTPTPPQIFEIGKCSTKMHLKHHEEQVEDILNYLEELSFHRIEKMEEGPLKAQVISMEVFVIPIGTTGQLELCSKKGGTYNEFIAVNLSTYMYERIAVDHIRGLTY